MWPPQTAETPAGGDEGFDLATVEVRPLYLAPAPVRPVHLRLATDGRLLADPRWQLRIGRTEAVRRDQMGIDKIDLTIAVDVAEGYNESNESKFVI